MKSILFLGSLCLLLSSHCLSAQNVRARTDEFEYDLIDQKKKITIPIIQWMLPLGEITYTEETLFKIKLDIESERALKQVVIYLKESEKSASREITSLKPQPGAEYNMPIERVLTLAKGVNFLEIEMENIDGQKAISHRIIHVVSVNISEAAKFERTDYALIFATDQYDHWSDLVNPIFDSKTIATELERTYGYKIELVENPTQSEMLKKLRDYAEKEYQPLDQLLIFFAGHGTFDNTFGEGFVVTKESIADEEGKTTYLSHNRLRSIINNIPCEHIFLSMDVCFGGTFDAALASSGSTEETYKEKNAEEFIARKLTFKTRKYLTSGGKAYVSDGIPGKHSPFARSFLEALRSRGGRDGVLTLTELYSYAERLKVRARYGEFGDNAPGSDFIFVVK